jgi:hypothetical protein
MSIHIISKFFNADNINLVNELQICNFITKGERRHKNKLATYLEVRILTFSPHFHVVDFPIYHMPRSVMAKNHTKTLDNLVIYQLEHH